jgi:hypothetical protein
VPYAATTPSLVLCANLAAYVQAQWGPTSPDGVSWDKFTRFAGPDDPNLKLVGRQVEFYPTQDYEWQPLTRKESLYTHRVSCLVVERYIAAGDVTRDWWAQRVDFVHDQVVTGLRFNAHGPAPFNAALKTLRGRVEVCDLEKLLSRNKLFYAYVELDFEEVVTLPSSP